MTPEDSLEKRISATPRREIPADWRARILAQATPKTPFAVILLGWLRAVFSFPHPAAWASVGAVWVVIAALNFSGPRGEELYAVTPKEFRGRMPSADVMLAQYEANRRLLVILSIEPALGGPEQPFNYKLRRREM